MYSSAGGGAGSGGMDGMGGVGDCCSSADSSSGRTCGLPLPVHHTKLPISYQFSTRATKDLSVT